MLRLVVSLAVSLALPAHGLAQTDQGVPDAGPVDAEVPDAAAAEPAEDDEAEPAEEDDAQPDEENAEGIATAEIGRRIEETFRQLQDLTPRLRRQEDYRIILRALPPFASVLGVMLEEPALERLDTLTPAALEELEQEWTRIRNRLLGWQEDLEKRSFELSEARAEAVEASELWAQTRDGDRPEALPASQLERIDTLLTRIERVIERLDRRLYEVLGLQGELSDQGIIVARTLARITSAQRRARNRRLRPDHRPLWEGWAPLEDAPGEPDPSEVTREHLASLGTFVSTERSRLLWHLLAFLLIGAGLVTLQLRSSLRPDGRPSAHRAARRSPVASAVLVTLVAAPLFYPYVPVVVESVVRLLLVPAIIVLAPQLLRAAPRPIIALAILAGLSVPMSLGYTQGITRRLVLGGFQLLALLATSWLLLPEVARRTREEDSARRWLYGLVRLSLLPQIFAIYFHVAGFVERAELWTYATLRTVELIVGIFVSTELAVALFREWLRQPSARVFYTVRDRRRWAGDLFRRAAWLFAGISLAYLILASFDVLEPTWEATATGLNEEYEVGSAEFTPGRVLAFLVTIGGAFLVIRVVYGLLEHEILPRTQLEEGMASAINLSISYVLAAIGILLAFAAAGVQPEQLALLGGALGVGIGFGLQNIVSNFVSGLILVAERPIEVGDTIQLDELVGEVRRIGVRSSTVQALNGAEVIVPNADLISSQLINWTLTDSRRRLELVIGTGYQHAPKDVLPLLERIVRSQPGILRDPEPDVLCLGFGESSIDFVVRAWTPGYTRADRIRSLLALRVYDALGDAGIEIPFPQRDVHLRSVDGDAAAERDSERSPAPPEPGSPPDSLPAGLTATPGAFEPGGRR